MLIFDQGTMSIQWGKKSLSQTLLEKLGISMEEKMNLDPYLILYTSTNSQWIIELNIKSGTVTIS